jgi:hypothetical protein
MLGEEEIHREVAFLCRLYCHIQHVESTLRAWLAASRELRREQIVTASLVTMQCGAPFHTYRTIKQPLTTGE